MRRKKELEKHKITVEINPLQMAVLLDTFWNCLQEIHGALDSLSSPEFKVNLSEVENAVAGLYISCFSESELCVPAKKVFDESGSVPDMNDLLKSFPEEYPPTLGIGTVKSVELEVVPMYTMLALYFLKGYFFQCLRVIHDEYNSRFEAVPDAMIKSIDEIFEKSVGQTDIREKTAPITEIFEMTGKFPDLDQVFGEDSKAN